MGDITVAEPKLIDYYSILNLPPKADLAGIENAYARLSDELALRMEVDETSGVALRRVNEAYSVLSRPELRREYDKVYFIRERAVEENRLISSVRRHEVMRKILISALALVVVFQVVALVYVGQDEIASFLSMAFDPFTPGEAN